ncbi:hypothetical protein G210_3516 [Candida maltosa Xu316]|uniref:Uncharacterized protein n=1 Tax=Candida maltosa (strain Xu316) TaxID=1245528 RepID=M3JV32_CANMX|nr:hypothetical protein G210_3516 [Candida maltosa Xu316]
MSVLHLSQFPLEILDIIISYLPKSELDKLNGIDYLKGPVLRNIYSSVTITGCIPHDSKWTGPSLPKILSYSQLDNSKPGFSCFNSLTDFLRENHLPLPRNIYFAHFVDIVLVYDSNPNLLKESIIKTDLQPPYGNSACSSDLKRHYLQRLISLPLKIRNARYCENIDDMMDEASGQFTRKLTSAHFCRVCPLDSTFEDGNYQNLVNLNLIFEITHEVVKYIPKSVKKLNCRILCTQFKSQEFGFPSGLRDLIVTLVNYPKKSRVNFTNLGHLLNLEYYIIHNGYKADYYNVSFPKSLKSVTTFSLDMVEVKNQCPELAHLHCLTVRHSERNDNAFQLPGKLTHLCMEDNLLTNIEKYENDSSIKFPKNLQTLYIVGDPSFSRPRFEFDESQTLFSNKEENILQNLTSMTLFQVEEFMKFGPIPASLTELTIHAPSQRVGPLDNDFFTNLKSVTNLKVLKINCRLNSNFDYELPPKLEYFELTNAKLCKISLRSKSLTCLRLKGGKFNNVTSENVQIPESLVELALYDCGITSFHDSFEFPKNLQILNLDIRKVEFIPKLPPKLKIFHISYKAQTMNQTDFAKLPTTLEELFIMNSENTKEYSFTPDVTHLVNLKKLSFLSLNFRSFGVGLVNLDNFPKSITDLSLCTCGIQKFTGNFSNFSKLKNLNLRGNKLGNWLSSSPIEFSFGAAIQTIELRYNKIDSETVSNLLYNLKKNSSFGFLVVEKLSIPEDIQHLARYS